MEVAGSLRAVAGVFGLSAAREVSDSEGRIEGRVCVTACDSAVGGG